jgi:hypothetical protein
MRGNAKEIGIKTISDEKFEKEMVEMRVHLNVLMRRTKDIAGQ